MFKSRCYNGGKKHKFVACYNEKPRGLGGVKIKGMDASEMKELLVYKEYKGHICKWCGMTVRDNALEEKNNDTIR